MKVLAGTLHTFDFFCCMNRIPTSPPIISSLPLNNRPLWSVMIPVYNCSKYIQEALNSVLKQDMGEDKMQIEVIDDASTDADVEAIVNQIGKGRIKYFRQQENVGSLRNFETCINRSKGLLIHLLHGDDRIKEGFYEKIAILFQRYPQAGAAFCRYSFIDQMGKHWYNAEIEQIEEGILENWLYRIAEWQRVQYVAMVVKREVYERLGSYYGMTYGEDWEMWVRIAKYYPVAYTPQILAEYRKHLGSISWPTTNDGQITRDLAYTLELIQKHLPKEKIGILNKAKKDCALFCLTKANVIWNETRNRVFAEKQIKLALSLNKSPKLYYHIFKFYIKVALKIY